MPQTKVNTPDGKKITINHPEGASEEEILAFAHQSYNPNQGREVSMPPNTVLGSRVSKGLSLGGQIGEGLTSFLADIPSSIAAVGAGAAASSFIDSPDTAAEVFEAGAGLVPGTTPQTRGGQVTKDVLTAPFDLFERFSDRAGEKVSDLTGSPAAGAGVKAGIGFLPFLAGRRGTRTARQNLAAEAQKKGFVVDPSSVTRSASGAGEGFGGKIKTQQQASQANTARAQELVREELGMPSDVPLSADQLAAYRRTQAQAHNTLRSQGDVTFGTPFRRALSHATRSLKALEKESPGITKAKDFLARAESLGKKQTMSFDAAVDFVQILRERADKAFNKGHNKQGAAWKDTANAIEDAMEAELRRRGDFELVKNFREARKNIAKSYTVQNALDKPTGSTVSPTKLASSKAPLSGNLEFIAKFASEFPKINRVLNESIPNFSVLDFTVGGSSLGGAITAAASGNAPVAAALLLPFLTQASRPLLRANALGPLGQRAAVTPQPVGFGPGLLTGSELAQEGLDPNRR